MSRYLKINLKNTEPLRIADDKTSQHGQTGTLRYIPGSAIRGYVMSVLARDEKQFALWKSAFFNGQIRFFNAYLSVNGKELIPSLKGFYEDKTVQTGKKNIQNVIRDDVDSGLKRASLGSYCYVEGDCIRYTGIELSEDININNGRTVGDNRNIYRSQYICKGQSFIGYVELADTVDPKLAETVEILLNKPFVIGNRRSGGYGTCSAACTKLQNEIPYASVRTQKTGKEFYLLLLSNTVMRSEIGELTGLNLTELARRLGCETLNLKRCATSTAQVYGYNRIWKGTIPSSTMYEAGSVFWIEADQEISEERFRQVEEDGIGIRTAEGFGQVAFMADMEKLKSKWAIEQKQTVSEEKDFYTRYQESVKADCRLAARGLLEHRIERAIEQYVVDRSDMDFRGVSASQKGHLASMCIMLQYAPEQAEEYLSKFKEKSETRDNRLKKQNNRTRKDSFHFYIDRILKTDLYDLLEISQERLLGIPVQELMSGEEKVRYKLQLMERQIRFANREGRKNGR